MDQVRTEMMNNPIMGCFTWCIQGIAHRMLNIVVKDLPPKEESPRQTAGQESVLLECQLREESLCLLFTHTDHIQHMCKVLIKAESFSMFGDFRLHFVRIHNFEPRFPRCIFLGTTAHQKLHFDLERKRHGGERAASERGRGEG